MYRTLKYKLYILLYFKRDTYKEYPENEKPAIFSDKRVSIKVSPSDASKPCL